MKSLIESKLSEFGLSEKAAKVYLAGLASGPITAQQLSNSSGVNRPTTYVMIESLMAKGLMSSFKKGKKTFFTSSTPERLMEIIQEQKENIKTREKEINAIIPQLKLLAAFSSNPPNVRYYEGADGINALRNDVLRTDADVLRELFPAEEVGKFLSKEVGSDDLRDEIKKKYLVKTIFASENCNNERVKIGKNESRHILKEKYPISCEVIIYGNKVAFLTFVGKQAGFLVESVPVAETMIVLFESLWESADTKKRS
ncbi:hypothetical protein KKE28_03835 [Patescibacteria group bacterium]|nr:hypothetical protein [Patescibacteria group bacterium]